MIFSRAFNTTMKEYEEMINEWKKGAKYWDHAWNPVIGCRKVSEGCEHCYAERMTEKFDINGGDFSPRLMVVKNPPKSGTVFVGNMTDLFGEWNTDYDIRYWLGILSTSSVNLILTKRAERLAKIWDVYPELADADWINFGVTAENQARAEERIPHLLKCDAKSRWLSLEPLLGEIDLLEYLCDHKACNDWGSGTCDNETCPSRKINWVVVGAESGKDARPCELEWIEDIVAQCQAAGVPVFVKQIHLNGKLVTDISKFPEHLQIRQVPWT